jgi:hypothetical protein
MGTRSLTYVYDNGEPVVCMYRQFDGYPTGHGFELAEWLNKGRLVNGLNLREKQIVYNGMGCLAAQMVSKFKEGAGGIYLYAPKLGQDCWQEYEYHLHEDKVLITTPRAEEIIFMGDWKQFEEYCSGEQKEEAQTVFDGSQVGQDWLKSVLRDGVVTVNFVKSDGTERAMKCTLSKDIVPQAPVVEGVEKKTKTQSPDVLPVYDVDAQGWRSFRWDSIKSVELV